MKMGKKIGKGRTREVEEPDLEGVEILEEAPEISALKSQIGDGTYTVRVLRKAADGSMERFPAIPLDEFNADAVAERYGGGDYRFDVIDSDNNQYVKRFRVRYSTAIKPLGEPARAAERPAGPSPEFAVLLQMIQAANAQSMTMMAEVVKAISSKPAGPSIQELAATMKMLKDLDGGSKSEAIIAETVKNSLAMASKFVEMGRDAAADVEPEGKLLGKLGDILPDLIDKLTQRPPSRQVVKRSLPAPAPATPTPAPAPAAAQAAPAAPYLAQYPRVTILLKQIAPVLMEYARQNRPAGPAAEEIVSKLPDDQALNDEVLAFAEDPDAVNIFCQVYSPIAAWAPWLRELVKAIPGCFDVEEPTAPESSDNGAKTVDAIPVEAVPGAGPQEPGG